MKHWLALLSLSIACLAPPARAEPLRASTMLDDATSQLGIGLRVDFGGTTGSGRTSLALTTTSGLEERQFTMPLLAVDFKARRTRIGTLLGLRLRQSSAHHDVIIRPLLTPVTVSH